MRKHIDFNYVDIHSHILFGVDDGPDNIETSREMLKIAYEEGIRKIVATPHYHREKCAIEYDNVRKRFEVFKENVKNVYPQIELKLGREVYYTSDIVEELEKGVNLSMENTKYILLEFYPTVEYSYLRRGINNVMQMGYLPIIAHIERYICILEKWELACELKEMGAVIQINSDSVVGTAGSKVRKFVKRLMKEQIVDLIGTDAHSSGRRAPRMQECAQYVCRKYGESYARDMLHDNAEKILRGEYLED